MLSKLPLIGRVLGIGLGLVGVVLFIMVAVNENNAPGFVSFGMISTILGIIIAVLSFILALFVNPQGIKGVGIGLAAILVIGLISCSRQTVQILMNIKTLQKPRQKRRAQC